MNLEITVDYERSASAGAGDTFQIESVRDAGTGNDLTKRVDVGRHFSIDDDKLSKYLVKTFGEGTTYDIV